TFVRQSPAEVEPAAVSFEAIARRAWSGGGESERELELDEETPEGSYLRADADALGELFSELFENAIEHGAPPVAAGRTADGFYVADEGPGIDDPDRVFEPGYSETPAGTGLGLAIVREIARAHGWTVSIVDADGARIEVRGVAAE
ncbi:histidine kinase, partial [Halobacteriales archaeon QH_10_67_13]